MKLKLLFIIIVGALALTGCASSNTINVKLQPQSADPAAASSSAKATEDKPASVGQNDNQINQNQMSIGKTTTNNAPGTADSKLLAVYSGAILHTNFGDIEVKFYNDEAPITVTNFLKLAQAGFYDSTKFHRVIPNFMIQGGDPNSKDSDWSNDGTGGPGYQFNDEPNNEKLVYGSMAMANSGPNTNGSQFFIVTKTDGTSWLDGSYNNFGHVVKGMDVALKIVNLPRNANDHPTTDAVIKSVTLVKK
jgi:cyclophilin family peptidyl-prolyl cis-trans isomerase